MANNMHHSTQTDMRSVGNLEEKDSDMPSCCTVYSREKVERWLVPPPWTDQYGHNPSCIREHGSILYLGMATEILNLP